MIISKITGYFINYTRKYLKARNVLVHGTQQIETITFFSQNLNLRLGSYYQLFYEALTDTHSHQEHRLSRTRCSGL